jgi:hypothetical protein
VGGWWSGPPKRWQGTVEQSRSIDVLRFHRKGMLAATGPWLWRWTRARDGTEVGSIGIAGGLRGDGAAVRVSYTQTVNGGESIRRDYEVSIERTPCAYGGSRPWFRCPNCGRRSRFLYLTESLFACRLCARLTHWTRRIHRDGGYESGWIEEQIDKLMTRMFRARSPKRRAHLQARLERLGERRDAIWGAMISRLGIRL